MKRYLQIHPADNVAVALEDFNKLDIINLEDQNLLISEKIPVKHKVALKDFFVGEEIKMYNVTVGKARTPILKGSRISTENTTHATEVFNTLQHQYHWKAPDVSRFQHRTFKGYHRKDGTVGIRNYWIILPLVFCEKRNVVVIQEALMKGLGYPTNEDFKVNTDKLVDIYKQGGNVDDILNSNILLTRSELSGQRVFKNVDGIKILNHDLGCGGTRQDADSLCRLLAGYVLNPNVAGATVLSLGCQNAQISLFTDALNR
ncbi:MAG: UxaA family hydrolase, partial [Saprospiraceae bacterium]